MKKLKNKTLLGFILGAVIFSGIGVAASAILATDITYTKSDNSTTNVQTAINDLYNLSKTHCPDNNNCHDIENRRVVPATYGETYRAIVYLDPATPSKNCTAKNSTVGDGISGCMKWYVFSETATTYDMILDHNTFGGNYTNSDQQLTSLKEGGNGWNTSLNTRMITGQEVANIVGAKTWVAGGYAKEFDSNCHFNNGSGNSCETGSNKYYWLFDYTSGCTSHGCKTTGNNSHGSAYWTSTQYSSDQHHYVFKGLLGNEGNAQTYAGLRPVITVNKSDLGL